MNIRAYHVLDEELQPKRSRTSVSSTSSRTKTKTQPKAPIRSGSYEDLLDDEDPSMNEAIMNSLRDAEAKYIRTPKSLSSPLSEGETTWNKHVNEVFLKCGGRKKWRMEGYGGLEGAIKGGFLRLAYRIVHRFGYELIEVEFARGHLRNSIEFKLDFEDMDGRQSSLSVSIIFIGMLLVWSTASI